ncbi:MAG: PaaI family thioesterase [Pseudomonadota bacterium]
MNDFSLSSVAHPFADLVGLQVTARGGGHCTSEILVREALMNPNNMVHGAVIYALADTGMGGALTSVLRPTQMCSTVEIKINYFRPAVSGRLRAETRVIHQGSRTAALESDVFNDNDKLVARASGTFMILERPSESPVAEPS